MDNLDKILTSVEPYLKSLGLEIPDIDISLLNVGDWKTFQEKRRITGSEGAFIPADNHIYFPKGKITIPVFIHEYFGHGLFMKNSELGLKINLLEKQLKGIEANLLKLSEEGRKTEEPVRDQIRRLLDYHVQIAESFAVWMEDYLLGKTRRKRSFAGRVETVHKKNRAVYRAYLNLKKIEKDKGPLTLLLKLQFNKDLDNSLVKKVAEENLKPAQNGIELILLYGSKTKRHDLDLLAVYSDKKSIKNQEYLGEIDINKISKQDLITRLKLFDIEFTEPINNGEIIIGRSSELNSLKKVIKNSEINEEVLQYNLLRSMEMYNDAKFFLNKARTDHNTQLMYNTQDVLSVRDSILDNADFESLELLYALVNMSYGFSYLSVFDRLKSKKKPISCQGMISKPTRASDFLLKTTMGHIKNTQSQKDQPSYQRTSRILNQLQGLILESFY